MRKASTRRYFFKKGQKGWSVSEKEIWTEVFFLLHEILLSFDKLKKVYPDAKREVGSIYSSRRRGGDAGTDSPLLDFEFYYNDFSLRAVAYRDKILQLVSVFLKLGIPVDQVKKSLVLEMEHVRRKKVLKKV
ncbi:MAG: hypothetical protein V1685_00240, partial [Parcubacteria group bacterium]